MNNTVIQEEEFKYSKMLSSLFCSSSIIILSVLCLLNNLTLDMYSAIQLLKIVLPASFCFWFIGLIIGKILDKRTIKIIEEQIVEEQKAYEIPSMFAGTEEQTEEEFGELS